MCSGKEEVSAKEFDDVHNYERNLIRNRQLRAFVNYVSANSIECSDAAISNDCKNRLNKILERLKISVEVELNESAEDQLERDVPTSENWNMFKKDVHEIIERTVDSTASVAIEDWMSKVLEHEPSDPNEEERAIGLALSGGGIRSAAFNLGVLQALDKTDSFIKIDYLSTVSGGGYIGASLTWFVHFFMEMYSKSFFPFKQSNTETSKQSENRAEASKQDEIDPKVDILSYIRRHASYLTPGEGLGQAALFAAIARGVFINLLVLISLFFLILYVLSLGLEQCQWPAWTGADCIGAGGGPFSFQKLQQSPYLIVSLLFTASILLKIYRLYLNNYFSELKEGVLLNKDLIAKSIFVINSLSEPKKGAKPCEAYKEAIAKLFLWFIMFLLAGYFGEWLLDKWQIDRNIFLIFPTLVIGIVLLIGSSANIKNTTDRSEWPLRRAFIEVLAWLLVGWSLFVVLQAVPDSFEARFYLTKYPPALLFFLLIGVTYLSKLLINYLFLAVLSITDIRPRFHRHRHYSIEYGDLLVAGLVSGLLGLVPIMHYLIFETVFFTEYSREFMTTVSTSGVISIIFGWGFRTPAREQRGFVAILLRIGLTLLVISAILMGYHVVVQWHFAEPTFPFWVIAFWSLILIILMNADINFVSMHRYYRNRLKEAFIFPDTKSDPADFNPRTLDPHNPDANKLSDNATLQELRQTLDKNKSDAPYHLINTNLVTVGSADARLRNRGGDSFTFSPGFIGSRSTGYISTSVAEFNNMDLATAMAISGAAVDPNTGSTRSWPLRIIMTWLNFRLGYWCPNPNPNERWTNPLGKWWQSSWIVLILKEMLGRPSENYNYVRLSDGGHFENLGLYELVRRQCRFIVVSDAGADPDYSLSDLAIALERVRVDFNVDIDIYDISDVMPKSSSDKAAGSEGGKRTKRGTIGQTKDLNLRLSKKPYAIGKITYDQEKNVTGVLVYIKSTLFAELPEDVMGYARKHPTFPDESTGDQFFSEIQFEAYRELGYRAALRTFNDTCIT